MYNSDYLPGERGLCLDFDEKTSFKIVYKGQVVMSANERPYLENLLSQFKGMGLRSILEVGFGLGISAEIIQEIVRPIETHDIIEIESSIFQDLCSFGKKCLNVRPILADFYKYDFRRTYDFLFYDPYDYGLSDLSVVDQHALIEHYQREEALRAHSLLNVGGVLCHPFFGDIEMPEIPGFRRITRGLILVPTFPLWDGFGCEVGQLGYYVRKG